MIVSRFTSFTKNFVICCCQVTKLSARSTAAPVCFLQAALVILVLIQISQLRNFEKWVKILCFLDTTFVRRSESESWGPVSLLSPSDCSEPRNWPPSTGPLVLRRRRLDVESSVESCGSNLGNVLAVELEEPVDNPWAALKLIHEKNSRVRPYELEHFQPQDSP